MGAHDTKLPCLSVYLLTLHYFVPVLVFCSCILLPDVLPHFSVTIDIDITVYSVRMTDFKQVSLPGPEAVSRNKYLEPKNTDVSQWGGKAMYIHLSPTGIFVRIKQCVCRCVCMCVF